jgi:hypothetical protein
VKLYDRGTCASFAVSARAGLPLAVELPEWIAPLLPGAPALFHPVVALHTGIACDYGYFLMLQGALVELAGGRGARPTAMLRAVARAVRGFAEALAACPLEEGEPLRTTLRALAFDAGALFAPAEPRREGLEELAVLVSDLLRIFSLADEGEADEDRVMRRRKRDMSQVLAQLLALVEGRLFARPLDPERERAAGVEIGEEMDEVFRISLRQQLFGKRALADRRPGAGMLRLALCHLVARAGARMKAAADSQVRVRIEDLSFGHTLAFRVLGQLSPEVWVEHEAKVWAITEALEALA